MKKPKLGYAFTFLIRMIIIVIIGVICKGSTDTSWFPFAVTFTGREVLFMLTAIAAWGFFIVMRFRTELFDVT